MVTQFEVLSAPGVDEDSGMSSSSPLEGLMEYPMEHTEFEYFHTNLSSDSYYDASQPSGLGDTLVPPTSVTPTPMTQCISNAYDANGCYDGTIMIYDQDNSPPLNNNVAQFNDGLESPCNTKPLEEDIRSNEHEALSFSQDVSRYDDLSGSLYDSIGASNPQTDEFSLGSLCDNFDHDPQICMKEELGMKEDISIKEEINTNDEDDEEMAPRYWEEAVVTTGKGKIGPLQRRALDSIFSVTEKPSRGLVSHIASELGLHHLTVKNFFSNGRRRLRRAAARLNDPERTKRENERRKEKRRLAALASAALSGGEARTVINHTRVAPSRSPPAESPPPRETPVLSPERKALMEKLADKVQRSVAQRTQAADTGLLLDKSSHSALPHKSHDFLLQPSQDVLVQQPQNDILLQASQDILSHVASDIAPHSSHHDLLDHSTHTSHHILSQSVHSNHDLMNPLTQELLDQSTHSPHDLLSPSTDVLNQSTHTPHDFLDQPGHSSHDLLNQSHMAHTLLNQSQHDFLAQATHELVHSKSPSPPPLLQPHTASIWNNLF